MISEEIYEPKVLRDTRKHEEKFRSMLPDPENFPQVWDFATTNEAFILCHLPELRDRKQVFKAFTQNYHGNVDEKNAWLWIMDGLSYREMINNNINFMV